MTLRATAIVAATFISALASLVSAEREAPPIQTADFIEVPGGPFAMGADRARDPEAFDNERWSSAVSEGSVDVPTFLIARREVTVSQFAAFVRDRRWTVDPRALALPPSDPVAFVSWPDALAYCRWLQAALGTSSDTPAQVASRLGAGWRVTLPTEAEWEKAVRVLDRGQLSWGRVAEWTRSPYQPYPYDPSDDWSNLEADALWVIRGGISDDSARKPRATARTGADPGARRAFIGFRVAISPPPAPPSRGR